MNSTAVIPTPLPHIARFESLAYGMFIHWGLYSQLGRGEWVQHQEKIPVAEYAALKDTFTNSSGVILVTPSDRSTVMSVATAGGMISMTSTPASSSWNRSDWVYE